ncbi:hypothetical protein BpHYR1_036686 [Brachionus plicatilis]|uniref:Uncharacterized protein n=1 Tax=Brachionus plicatilis TaxID=10195 RepID=A0A3M7QKP7_BRAPC|nr:hypothetical protein BpHYR1_036686 [Brachionus plicatilis]
MEKKSFLRLSFKSLIKQLKSNLMAQHLTMTYNLTNYFRDFTENINLNLKKKMKVKDLKTL